MNPYRRQLPNGVGIDVYEILLAYEVTHPCLQHAIKKLLADGTGEKDRTTNIKEARACIDRYFEILAEKEAQEPTVPIPIVSQSEILANLGNAYESPKWNDKW
jgi:hypothetical protein